MIETAIKIMETNPTDLERLKLYEQVIYAAVLAEFEPPEVLHDLEAILSSDLTPSRYLNNKVIDFLVDRGLLDTEKASAKRIRLNIKNSDVNLSWLLGNIRKVGMTAGAGDETVTWIKELLIAECIHHVCYFAACKGITLSTSKKPPEVLYELINVRPVNELKMLSWQITAGLTTRDLRLISLGPDDSALDKLFDKVLIYHGNYLKSNRKVSTFKNSRDHKVSSLSQIVSQYLLGITTQKFETQSLKQLVGQ